MEFTNTEWPVSELIELISKEQIDLNPDYQRNAVWRSSSQIKLLESILHERPIPSFFIRRKANGKYEMVDGQQRARAIYGYWIGEIPDHTNQYFEKQCLSDTSGGFKRRFLNYKLSITIIENLSPDEKIEDYYALLNSSGLRLNRPELKKAEHYNTRFLNLVKSAVEYESFVDLELFSQYAVSRMNDFEITCEIIAQMKFGPFDKKEKVDQLFEDDIGKQEEAILMESFCLVFDKISKLDQVYPVRRTRLKQKADLLTYSYLTHQLSRYSESTHIHLYKNFLKIAPHIRPSNENCDPLREYAHNCVAQSNSKLARHTRYQILLDLLANSEPKPNERQLQVLDYFEIDDSKLMSVEGMLTFDFSALKDPNQQELNLDDFLGNVL